MLSWSNAAYKVTLGGGSLGVIAVLSDLWQDVMPVWLAVAIALLPFVVFVFVHPGELPARVVGLAHLAASVWYFAVAVSLYLALLTSDKPLSRGWQVYPLLAALGAVPSGIVLFRWSRGNYPPAEPLRK